MGQRLRQLRTDRGLQQGEVARRLEISPAYLSLIEKGRRVVQLPLLLKALELYDVGVEEFMRSLGEHRVDDALARLLDEPLLRSLNLTEEDVSGMSAEPKVVTTITALFNLYKSTRSQLDSVLAGIAQRERSGGSEDPEPDSALRFELSPFDEVTDFLEKNDNFFPLLEERADKFRSDQGLGHRLSGDALVGALRERLGIDVKFTSPEGPSSVIRRWDPEKSVLTLSPAMLGPRVKFQLAHTIALRLLDSEHLHEPMLLGYRSRFDETKKLIKIHLANYLAGALLLPYTEFFNEVRRSRYDVEQLGHSFGTSYETVAHRICNLSDPKQKGLPMHFVRVDVAGNISKRYSATGIRFPPYSGACPKSAFHMAFLTPNTLARQYEVFPDGGTYFCFAKVVSEPKRGSLARGTVYSIGLGTHADNAKHLAYADDMPFADPKRMAVPVGITCRFCQRTDCNQRAAPSYKFAFRVDEYIKKDNFFSPLVHGDE